MHWRHWCPRVKWKSSLMNSTNVFSLYQLIHRHEPHSSSVYYLFQKTGSVTGLFSQGPIRSTIKQAKLSSAKRLCEHLLQAGNYPHFTTTQCQQLFVPLRRTQRASIGWNSWAILPSILYHRRRRHHRMGLVRRTQSETRFHSTQATVQESSKSMSFLGYWVIVLC